MSIGGGSRSRSQSTQEATAFNRAFPFLMSTLAPQVRTGVQAGNALADLLNIGGNRSAGAARGYQNFLNSTGYQHQFSQGQEAITTSNAARGLLNSGETLKRLTTFGQGLAAQSFQNYLANVAGVANLGLGAAGTISGAGGFSQSRGQSTSSSKESSGFPLGEIIGAVGGFFLGGPVGAAAGGAIGGGFPLG